VVSAAAAQPHESPLEIAAHELSALHVVAAAGARARRLDALARLGELSDWLDHAREQLAEPDPALAKAAEWLLDNDYLVQRAASQVREHLPWPFYERLPLLAEGPERATPRVWSIARTLLETSALQVSLPTVTRFVDAYQRRHTLDIGELWALPAMLRLGCLETLVSAFARLLPGLAAPFAAEPAGATPAPLDDTERVARAIGALRALAAVPWRDFFLEASAVEAVLHHDPSGDYPRSDFTTRDRCRAVVEKLARGTRRPEPEVAERVVAIARRAAHGEPRAHVGHWLLDRGREALERELGYRPTLRERWQRGLAARAGPLYAASLVLATGALLLLPGLYLARAGAGPWGFSAGLLLALPAAFSLAVTAVHWAVARFVPPRILPKLDFEKGIPGDCRCAVVVPALVTSADAVPELLAQLERHQLANPDPSTRFVLLSDFGDAPAEHMPGDAALLERIASGIDVLNRRHEAEGPGPFHALHRPRRFDAAEGCWMGWERKRGKLVEFDRLVSGEPAQFVLREGDTDALRGIRFVVTLDADTTLPKGALARLVGTLAHPLNRAEFDAQRGRVNAGYTVIQPRVEISPDSGSRSLFARAYSGDTAIDIYSRAVSDVYMDLFGSGIFVGKGLYEVESFRRSLAGRVPTDALVSHDLFEGSHGRVALATDIVVYEDFPSHYLAFTRRLARWTRGDWQLLPWLCRQVPGAGGARLPNRLSRLERWKILDNLRRSLLPVALLALFAAGWLLLPGGAWFWTLFAVFAPAGGLFSELGTGLACGRRRGALRDLARRATEQGSRYGLALAFLPHEAAIAANAIGRTLGRLFVTHRHLLEWTPSALAPGAGGPCSRRVVWQQMWPAPLLALGLGAAVAWLRPEALPAAAPLLLSWIASPEIAHRISQPRAPRRDVRRPEDDAFLRSLARRTWLFFETFVGPDDQWLPPDNFQEDPRGEIAHRTSPTNVGMMFLSSLAAWDLGYVGLLDLASRLDASLDTLEQLERYRGHVLNWYDTRTLEPLEPRYVSSVDSGNLAVSLVTLQQGCRELADGPALAPQRWDGLEDTLALLGRALERLPPDWRSRYGAELLGLLARIHAKAREARADPAAWSAVLADLCECECREFDRLLMASFQARPGSFGLVALREVRVWLERAHHHLRSMQRDVEHLAGWLARLAAPPARLAEPARDLSALLPATGRLDGLAERCAQARGRIVELRGSLGPLDAPEADWLASFEGAIDEGERNGAALRAQLLDAAERAGALAMGMDFGLLYDREMRLLHVGYNVGAERLDPHHYDLLASEARLASFFAIGKGDVPLEHWHALGRPLARAASQLVLRSWGGSMFEYLMPTLLVRSQAATLLAQSERVAVAAQRRHGTRLGIPWGVSESGFASLDADHNYRYRAFGVPDLGTGRGLERDAVVAPYASALALAVEPREALANLRQLERLGLVGTYGLYEAADFTSERIPVGQPHAVVRSYMAHHQGMVLAALDNHLCDAALQRRFQRDRRAETVDILLHERVPIELAPEPARVAELPRPRPRQRAAPMPGPWSPRANGPVPELHALGNGRLASLVSESGAGALRWREFALTRWTPDVTRDACGLWIYVRDLESGAVWSAGRQPTGVAADEYRVSFRAHLAEFHRRDDGIGLRMEIAVVPADDVEIRLLHVSNESGRSRSLALTSYAEVVLAAPDDDDRHPAFSKLFVHGESVASLDGLVFSRRPRRSGERPPVLLHRLLSEDPAIRCTAFETDREVVLGRHGGARYPAGLGALAGGSGFTLDPVMALETAFELEPNETKRLAFLTLTAGSRESVLELAARYDSLAALEWALADAAHEAAREVQRVGLAPEQLPQIQALLSLVLHPQPALRAPETAVAANRLGQPRLWGLGISGDAPILLLHTGDKEVELLQQLVRAHQLWRRHGIGIDLVVLCEVASGYADPLRERLLEWLHDLGAQELLGRRAGIHLLPTDQIGDDDRRLLGVAARVVLDAGAGGLAQQLAAASVEVRELPRFQPALALEPAEPTPPLERPTELRFDNGLGGFTPDGREYVIHLAPGARTPAPWCNVLANEEFGCLVTETGGGFSWSASSGENRLTPWANDPVADPVGEALYLRDEESAQVWTVTPQPAGDATACQVRFAAGWSEWRRNSRGLEQRMRVFVPVDDPVKIVQLQLRNRWKRRRRLTATYYAEWVLGALRSRSAPFVALGYDAADRALLARNPWNPDFAERVAFLASDRDPHGLTADRSEFLGREGDASAPAALARWGLSGRVRAGFDPCAALQVHVELGEDESTELSFVLGQGRDAEHTHELLQRWRDPGQAEAAFERLCAHWDRLLGAVTIRTPDPALDVLVNRWLLYQTLSSRVLGRAGYYQSGGAIGYRDQLQDVLALVHAEPARVRAHLLECARHQFEAGDVLHWWHPGSERGVRTRCSDDLLWLPFATCHYVEATGDLAILDEPVAFLAAPPLLPEEDDRYGRFEPGETRPFFEHCERALERGVTRGPQHLPLMGAGDWNDGMNRVGARGRGESVWLAWFCIATARSFADLCERRGEPHLAEAWRRRAREIEGAVAEVGWDGEWYRRAFDDEGRPWGSASCEECRIDSIAQSWSALCGLAPSERTRQALLSAERHLVREDDGVVRLLWPPFDATARDPGYIKAYPPGIRENGGQYTHAAVWLAWAFAAVGDGDRAARIFRLANPLHHGADAAGIAGYRVEPYVIAADLGARAPHVGRGGWTWYTGSAAWAWRFAVEGLLGLQRRQGALRIAPCLPRAWRGFEATLRCEGGVLDLRVEDPDGLGRGAVEIEVDGEAVAGDALALPSDGRTHAVRVRIARPAAARAERAAERAGTGSR
jgi:cyclic beta-1,2-glucan synthetase